MPNFLNSTQDPGAQGDALQGGINALDKLLNNQNQIRSFEDDGFIVPPILSADGAGLPSSKIQPLRTGRAKRHIIHWFVPQVGVIKMYVNPQSIQISEQKLINQERTKGGYNLQYWGEQLTTLSISGHTGSSGFEGLMVLRDIYEAEQLTFDSVGLSLAANNSISGLNEMINNFASTLGGFGGLVGSATNGVLGLNPLTSNIMPRNISTLASLAFSVEMYYQGEVYRGYFNSFNYRESVDSLGLFTYEINFVVTQRRGFRVNNFPWQKSANNGPSDSGVPYSYSGLGR